MQEEELELLASAASHGYEMTPSQLRAITLSRSSKPPSAAGTQGKKFHGSGGGSAGGAGILHFAEDGVPVGSFPAGSGGAGGASAAGGSNGDDFRPGLEHALADVLPYLEDAETGLAAAGKSELIALATLPGPPPAVASVMGALMVILRRKEDWATAKASLLSGTDLLDAIFDFDKDDLSITQLHKLRTYATLPDFRYAFLLSLSFFLSLFLPPSLSLSLLSLLLLLYCFLCLPQLFKVTHTPPPPPLPSDFLQP